MIISINESGIFNVNVYIEMKTDFKIVADFITFLTPGKRVRTHGLECPYVEYIFTPSLFFINPDICEENCIHIFYAHFVRTPDHEAFHSPFAWTHMRLLTLLKQQGIV